MDYVTCIDCIDMHQICIRFDVNWLTNIYVSFGFILILTWLDDQDCRLCRARAPCRADHYCRPCVGLAVVAQKGFDVAIGGRWKIPTSWPYSCGPEGR